MPVGQLAPPALFLPAPAAKVEKSFSSLTLPHFSQFGFSALLRANFSNVWPHFLHLYSYSGIGLVLSHTSQQKRFQPVERDDVPERADVRGGRGEGRLACPLSLLPSPISDLPSPFSGVMVEYALSRKVNRPLTNAGLVR